jgi:hypothetical protein
MEGSLGSFENILKWMAVPNFNWSAAAQFDALMPSGQRHRLAYKKAALNVLMRLCYNGI